MQLNLGLGFFSPPPPGILNSTDVEFNSKTPSYLYVDILKDPKLWLEGRCITIIIIIIFLHGLGRLACCGIDALPSFPGVSTVSSSSVFIVEGVFRDSGVVHSFEVVDPVLFVFGSHVLYSRNLQFFLVTSFIILSSLVCPVTLLRKRISAASRPVMSLFVVTHVSLPYSSDGLGTTL